MHAQSALNGLDYARELREDAISGGVGDPPPVFRDQPVQDGSMGVQRLQRRDLVLAHQAGIALHVCSREDCCQPALHLERPLPEMETTMRQPATEGQTHRREVGPTRCPITPNE